MQFPQPQPPEDRGAAASPPDGLAATNENRRRTRLLPHEGQASTVSTAADIGRRSSNRRSHAMQRYSYAAMPEG